MNDDLKRALIISVISTVAVFYFQKWLTQEIVPPIEEPNPEENE